MGESGRLTVVSGGVARLADVAARCGLDREQILAEADIDPALLQQRDARLPIELFTRLWQLLGQKLPGRVPALEWTAAFQPSDMGVLGYVMVQASDLGDMLDTFCRYWRLVNQGLAPSLERGPSTAWMTFSPTAAMLAVQHLPEAMLARIDEASPVSHDAARRIAARLSSGEPDQGSIAKQMGISERTLQRRLQNEGTTFNKLLEDARRTIALGYLADRNLAAYEVSFLLGYAEPATFFRAFKRWTGQTPQQYRASVA